MSDVPTLAQEWPASERLPWPAKTKTTAVAITNGSRMARVQRDEEGITFMDTATPTSDVLTDAQMNSILRDDRERIDRAGQALEQAQSTYRYETQRGRHLSEEAHAAALRDRMPALESAEREAQRVADVSRRNTMSIRTQIENPGLALSPADAERAAAMAGVAKLEAESLPLAELEQRLRAAIARDDKAAMYLATVTMPARLNGDDARPLGREREAAQALRRMLSQARDVLRDASFDALHKETDGALLRADELRSKATKRRRQAEMENKPGVRIPRRDSGQ